MRAPMPSHCAYLGGCPIHFRTDLVQLCLSHHLDNKTESDMHGISARSTSINTGRR